MLWAFVRPWQANNLLSLRFRLWRTHHELTRRNCHHLQLHSATKVFRVGRGALCLAVFQFAVAIQSHRNKIDTVQRQRWVGRHRAFRRTWIRRTWSCRGRIRGSRIRWICIRGTWVCRTLSPFQSLQPVPCQRREFSFGIFLQVRIEIFRISAVLDGLPKCEFGEGVVRLSPAWPRRFRTATFRSGSRDGLLWRGSLLRRSRRRWFRNDLAAFALACRCNSINRQPRTERRQRDYREQGDETDRSTHWKSHSPKSKTWRHSLRTSLMLPQGKVRNNKTTETARSLRHETR